MSDYDFAPDDDDGETALSLPFDTDSRDFVRGVQVGMLFMACEAQQCTTLAVYADNAEMVARIIDNAEGVTVSVKIEDDDWLMVTVECPVHGGLPHVD